MTLRAFLKQKRGRTTMVAKAMGVSVAVISMWANHYRRIPAERCFLLRHITGVPLDSLRRDLFGKKNS